MRKNLAHTDPPAFKTDFRSIFASSASAVKRSEKVQLHQQEVHYALSNEPKMNIVRCP